MSSRTRCSRSETQPVMPDEVTLAPELAAPFQTIYQDLIQGTDYPDPGRLGGQLDTLIRYMLYSPTDLADILRAISVIHDALTTRIITHHVSELEALDHRPLPGDFCWIAMGSDARQEQVVRTDQDNALIYADPPRSEQKEWDAYFADLAKRVVTDLDRFGFALCKGDVMATNPLWRRSLTQWRQALDRWIGSSEPADIRTLTILLDFRPVFGDFPMAQALWDRVFDQFREHPAVSHFLTRDDVLFSSPKTIFGQIRTHRVTACRACFNIKTAGLAHLINAMRLLALNHGICSPSTLARMAGLKEKKVLEPSDHDQAMEAFYHLNRLKIGSHLNRDRHPDLPVNCVDLSTLSPAEKKRLKTVLDTVSHFQKQIQQAYSMKWMNFFN